MRIVEGNKILLVFGLLLVLSDRVVADQFDHLTTRFSGTRANLNAVTSGTNQYVAIGDGGLILCTTDTLVWSRPVSPTTNDLRGVIWANGLYIAVGFAGTILSSTEGVSWTTQISGTTNRLNGVGYNNGKFVAVGDAGTILYSTNGVRWNSIVTGVPYNLDGIGGGNATYSGSSSGLVIAGDSGTLLTSSDGLAWTIRSSGTFLGLNSVAYSSTGSFVVVGQSGVILTGGGSTWTVVYSGTTANLHGIALDAAGYYSGGIQGNNNPIGVFGAVGDAGTFLTSSDGGGTWNAQPTEATNNLYSVTYENGGFLAVGGTGSVQAGFIWVKRASGVTNSLQSVVWGSNRFVTVGSLGTALTSTNGANWTLGNSGTTDGLSDVIFDGNRFVAAGGRTLAVSTNGVDWTSRIIVGPGTNLTELAYGNGILVAMGTSYHFSGGPGYYLSSALVSTDAVNWIAASNSLSPVSGLAFGGNLFCGTENQSGGIVTSPDGVNWTAQNSGFCCSIGPVTYANGRFFTAGQYIISTGATMITSVDGSNWVDTVSGYFSGAPSYGHGAFVAVAEGGEIVGNIGGTCYLTSSDGSNWTSRGASNPLIEGIPAFNSTAFGAGTFVAVGGGGVISQSVPAPDFLSISNAVQGVNVTLTGDIGRTVLLETSTNLAADSWLVLLGVTNAPYRTTFLDAATNGLRFYRSREP
jgi:hypothetical protein